jgi:serralysin
MTMATVTTLVSLDMTDINFNRVYSGSTGSYFYNNITYNNVFYPNVFEVTWKYGSTYFDSVFGGQNLTYVDYGAQGKVITGGTANAYLELVWNGSTYNPTYLIEGISVSASVLYGTFATPTVTDDIAIITQALSGNDRLIGSPYNDVLTGYAGNDSYLGNAGNDTLVDFISGGGIDRTYYSDVSGSYNIRKSGEAFIVADKVANRDGTDTLYYIDRLIFKDGVVATDISGNAGQAYRLYQAALNRTPDQNGLAGWIKYLDEGNSLVSASQQFIDSGEFKTKYGALDDRNFVNQLYLNVLNRNGEAAGINGWVDGLAHGLSRAQVLQGFSESSENQARVLGQIENGIKYQEWWL